MQEILRKALDSLTQPPACVVDFPLGDTTVTLDLSKDNTELQAAWKSGQANLEPFIWQQISNLGGSAGVGGYGEDRRWYQRNAAFFQGEEARTIHLGVDVWVAARTAVIAPLDAIVHSFADNAAVGDYGPTVILKHTIDEIEFHTLYGHLERSSLKEMEVGKEISRGSAFAAVGPYEENGNWPAHLHFQIVFDMEDNLGDYPGVAAPSQLEQYFSNCPDPNLILQLKCLEA